MKPAACLLGLTLLTFPAISALAQTQSPTAAITVTRTGDACDITLSSEVAKTVQDQVWLVIDGKSEGFSGGDYSPDDAAKPLHFVTTVSSDLDGQVKDVLKAQGVSVNPRIVTYQISFGVNRPDEASISQTLRFRHGSNILSFKPLFHTPTEYKAGDKIILLDAVALDSGVAPSEILGKSAERQNQLPHDLLHRITIQVQFVPKTPGVP